MSKKTIKTYFVLEFFTGLSALFSTIYVIFLIDNGLNLFEASLLNTIFMASVLIFEVPTGLIADVFGRKNSLLLAYLLGGIGFLWYGLASSFWGFALAELIGAISVSLSSGAYLAWLVDSLNHRGFDGRIEKILSRGKIASWLGILLAGLIGAYLGKINLRFPWFLAGAINLLLVPFVWKLVKEDYFKRIKSNWQKRIKAFKEIALESFRKELKDRNVLGIFGLSLGFALATQAPNMQWQPLFMNFLPDTSGLGWIFAGVAGATILGNLSVEVLDANRRNIMFSALLIALSLSSFLFLRESFPLFLSFYLLHELGQGLILPLNTAFVNQHVASERRATVNSLGSMFFRLGAIGGLILTGYLANKFSIPLAFTVSGALLFASLGFGFLLDPGTRAVAEQLQRVDKNSK